MRYTEITEASKLERVRAAQAKKADAARTYQNRLKAIPKSTPMADVSAKQADARSDYQDRLASAEDRLAAVLSS